MTINRSIIYIYILERERGGKKRKKEREKERERKKETKKEREREKERERDRHMGYRSFIRTLPRTLPRPQFPLPRTVPHYNLLLQRFREHIWNVARNAFPGSAALPRNLVSSALPVFTSTRSSYFEPKIKRIHGVLVAAHIRMYVCTCAHMYVCTYVRMYVCTYVGR